MLITWYLQQILEHWQQNVHGCTQADDTPERKPVQMPFDIPGFGVVFENHGAAPRVRRMEFT